MKKITYEQLPPYGYMFEDWQEGGIARKPPGDWAKGKQAWIKWSNGIVDLIAANVWPRYDRKSCTWVGDARENAVALTQVDLGLIQEFRSMYFEKPAGAGFGGLSHQHFFQSEDVDWTDSFSSHCPGLSSADYSSVEATALGKKMGEFLPQEFKTFFQRPRPFQTAMLFGHGWFKYSKAKTAISPSLISGHAVQAAIVGCTNYYMLHNFDAALAKQYAGTIGRWAMGTGDHRVMGGVHYPSDSLASWIVALKLVDEMFDEPLVRRFLERSIRESLLYTFLAPRMTPRDEVGKVYDSAWKVLKATLR